MSNAPEGPWGQTPDGASSTETFFLGKAPLAQALPLRADALERGANLGRYVILDRIGSGGMGVVYSAYDPELDRKVALKLLRPDRDRSSGETGRLRLLREAQAIARLSHPNVIHVYDAGSFGDQVFLAMEFVEGRTLRRWLDEERPSWRDVLARFVLAGRGLAAAHAAGLVHRDFKPDNVLLGTDGRVRVVDFGLARPAGNLEAAAESDSSPGSGGILASPLTQGGVALGTPAYMAPEQLRGEAADARSDQFSFCVSLYEALHGDRPFPGTEPREIAEAVLRGAVREPPAGTRVPGRLRAVLFRGLSADPQRRHPSMEALLHDLERDPAAVRRRGLAAAAVLLATGALFSGLGYFQARRTRLCGGAEEKLMGIWDPAAKTEIRQAFLATRTPFAASAWQGVEPILDGYFGRWTGMRREACEATRLRGEQSEDLLDRRMLCLDQRLRDGTALAALFRRADAGVVEKAVAAASALPGVAGCGDVASLKARVPLPADAALRREVEAAGRDLARVRALRAAGKYPQGLAAVREISRRLENVPYRPAQAEVLYLLGDLQELAGDLQDAEPTLRRALLRAEAASDDEMKVRAAIALLRVLGEVRHEFERAAEWRSFAAATLERLPENGELQAEYLNQLGLVEKAEGLYPEALSHHQQAIALRRRFLGERSPELAASIGDAGVALYYLGRYPEAFTRFQEALRIQEATLGPRHPETARTLERIGNTLYQQGRYQEAVSYHQRALGIREAALGPEHRLVADSLNNLGNSLDLLNRRQEALAKYRRVYEIRIKVFGPRHAEVAAALNNIGTVYSNLRRFDEALLYHRRALEMRLATLGRDHPRTALTLHNVGNDYLLQGRYREALPYFREALAVEERTLGPDHPDVAEELTAIADLERRLGHPERALEPLERALRIVEAQELEPGAVARTRFALAQALWDTGGDRGRALRLARQARQAFLSQGEEDKVALDEVVQWLAERAGGNARKAPLG